MQETQIDTWLYGVLARYGGEPQNRTFVNLQVALPAGGLMRDLLATLQMDTAERGITFINGDLSAMPGVQPDMDHPLKDGDRVAFFHLQSMWPFQYRHGVGMIDEMQTAINGSENIGLHHTYRSMKMF
ncbi:MAG: MoaD/ThiS family protein [Anaerolineaceae bacterium]|nr:MoaD/ThiS family protein [Anaerolineaceae bacterium]